MHGRPIRDFQGFNQLHARFTAGLVRRAGAGEVVGEGQQSLYSCSSVLRIGRLSGCRLLPVSPVRRTQRLKLC